MSSEENKGSTRRAKICEAERGAKIGSTRQAGMEAVHEGTHQGVRKQQDEEMKWLRLRYRKEAEETEIAHEETCYITLQYAEQRTV